MSSPTPMTVPVRELSRVDLLPLERHLLSLGQADRRLRFGGSLGDFGVRGYVSGIPLERDALFGVVNDELDIIGAAHLARGDRHAELGLSVLPAHRHEGIGGALLQRSCTHARNWGVSRLFMHCLSENGAMMRLARRQGVDVVARGGEADAWLKLPPADASTALDEASDQRIALIDYALKAGSHCDAAASRPAVPAGQPSFHFKDSP